MTSGVRRVLRARRMTRRADLRRRSGVLQRRDPAVSRRPPARDRRRGGLRGRGRSSWTTDREDDSWERISQISRAWPRARGIRLTRNFGSQMAILAGLRRRPAQAAAVLSADLQEPPELLPELVAAWRGGATAVLAARTARPEPWATRAAANLYYRTLRRLAFETMPAGGFDCFLVGRPAIDFLTGSARGAHVPSRTHPLGRLPGGDRSLRARRARRGPLALDAREEGQVLHRLRDLVLVRALRWMSVAGAVFALVAFAYAALLIALKILPQPADPGLDLADGRARLLLGRAAPLARDPRRVPVADARRRPGAEGIPRAGEDRSAGPPAGSSGLTAAGDRFPDGLRHALDLHVRQLREHRQREDLVRGLLRIRESRPRDIPGRRSTPGGEGDRVEHRGRRFPPPRASRGTRSRSRTRTTYWWNTCRRPGATDGRTTRPAASASRSSSP